MLTSIGSRMQTYAIGWEIYQRTSSNAAIGFTGLVQFLPVLLLALPAGHLADRYNRKVLIQFAQVLAALASLGLAAVSIWQAPVNLVYPCLVLTAIGRSVSAPARSSLLSQVVPRPLLHNAVTWNSSGWQLATVGGPALGGLVVWLTGMAAPAYLLAAAGALGCASLLAPIRPRPLEQPPAARTLGSLLAGVKFIWRTKMLLAAITLDLFAVLLGGATALLPAYARDILHVDPLGLGFLARRRPSVPLSWRWRWPTVSR